MPRKDSLDVKVIDDCFEFLHLVEQGVSSMQELSEIFGVPGNKAESNYRQVERIKHRCQKYVQLDFDNDTMKFRTERNAKLKFLEAIETPPLNIVKRTEVFGFYIEKIPTDRRCKRLQLDEE